MAAQQAPAKSHAPTLAAWRRVNALPSLTVATMADRRALLNAGVIARFSLGGFVWTEGSVNLRSLREMRDYLN